MLARKLRVEYQHAGQLQPCPLKWLDNFSMRNFTNASVFDDTLPVADGWLEIGTRVPVDQLKDAMEDWFRRKSYLPKDATLVLTLACEPTSQTSRDNPDSSPHSGPTTFAQAPPRDANCTTRTL